MKLFFFFFFNLPWRKNCKIWWKKIVCMKRGGKKIPLQSQQIYSAWEKRNNFIGSRCWHCVSYWRWKEFTWTIAVTKEYWWQLESLWLITFTTDIRTAEKQKLYETKTEIRLLIFIYRIFRTQFRFVLCFLSSRIKDMSFRKFKASLRNWNLFSENMA